MDVGPTLAFAPTGQTDPTSPIPRRWPQRAPICPAPPSATSTACAAWTTRSPQKPSARYAGDSCGPTAPHHADWRPLTVEEIRQIIGDIDRSTPIGIRDAAIILLGYASAMRRAEIVALTLADIEPKPAGLLAAMRNDSVVWARSLALVPNDDLQCPHGAELGNHPRATRISATRSARRWVTTRVPPKRLPAVGTGFGTRSERCRDVCGRQCARTLGFRVQ